MAIGILALGLLCNLVYYASAQDCLTLQLTAPQTCCEPDTGNFCQIQCNNGLCRCVDPLTGMQISDFTFPDNDESIDCSLIIPDPPGTTTESVTTSTTLEATEPATTDVEEETSRSDSDSTSGTGNSTMRVDNGGGSGDSSRSDSSRSDSTSGNSTTDGQLMVSTATIEPVIAESNNLDGQNAAANLVSGVPGPSSFIMSSLKLVLLSVFPCILVFFL